MEVESESPAGPNWLDLPRDLTSNILQRLGAFEILTSACGVCPLWWNICNDPLMWRSICMCDYSSYYNNFFFGRVSNNDYDKEEMVKICCNAIERSCNQLEDIDIEGFGNDILNCIANNGSHLRSMRFVDCYEISDEGFIEVARKLPLLEKLNISDTSLTEVSIAVLGRSCPLLKSLKFSRLGDYAAKPSDDLALVTADTMTNLRHLDIKGDSLTNVGLLAILDKCPFLKSLDIRRCYSLELSISLKKRCTEQINHLQLPNSYDFDDYDYSPSYEYDFGGDYDPWYY